MVCGFFCLWLASVFVFIFRNSNSSAVFLRGVIASLPSLNPGRIFYGSITREDDRGDEAEEFRIEDAEVLRCGDGGAGQALSSIPGSTHSRRDPRLSVAFAGA